MTYHREYERLEAGRMSISVFQTFWFTYTDVALCFSSCKANYYLRPVRKELDIPLHSYLE